MNSVLSISAAVFLAASLFNSAFAQSSIVVNGGFEEGMVTDISGPHPVGWNPGFGFLMAALPGAAEGSYAAHPFELAYQDLSTAPATYYQLQFAVAAISNAVSVTVLWDTTEIGTFLTLPAPDHVGYLPLFPEWFEKDIIVFSDATTTRLTFQSQTPFLLDAVQVTAVPEPATFSLFLILLLGFVLGRSGTRRIES